MAGLLRTRLVGDAGAVAAAGEGELLESLADVLEALYTLAELHGYSVRNLEATRVAKSYLRGGYLRRRVVDAADPSH
jgi:predicted house-cleaning noncanonical NTP pyrophosphatase (MazG superfamily)